MRFVYIYGPPGVGKLTVGRHLCDLTGYKLFHNHLAVNLVTSIFQHDTDEYFALLREVRTAGFAAAARAGIDLVVTGVYRGTAVQDRAMAEMIEPVLASGGQPLFVQLSCDHDEWLGRLQTESRAALRKIIDPAIALGMLERFDLFAKMPFEPSVSIDTTGRPAREVAEQIASSLT